MSNDSGASRSLLIRTLLMLAIGASIFASAAASARGAGFTFFDPMQNDAWIEQMFGGDQMSNPHDERFLVTPANTDVIACSTGNTFTWTFTSRNPAHIGDDDAPASTDRSAADDGLAGRVNNQ